MKFAWPGFVCWSGILTALLVNIAPAYAQPSPRPAQPATGLVREGEWCVNKEADFPPDLQIQGCTAIIQAGRSTPEFPIAISYFQRGMAYAAKRDLDRAIDDFTAAIKLKPNFFEAYSNRGYLYSVKGDYGQAIADLTSAIRINPRFAKAFWLRGIAHLAHGESMEGDADIVRAIEIDPTGDTSGASPITMKYFGIPATARTCPLTVTIEKAGASAFVYTQGNAHPVRFEGPDSTKEVPLNGPYLFVVVVPPSRYTLTTSSPPGKSPCS